MKIKCKEDQELSTEGSRVFKKVQKHQGKTRNFRQKVQKLAKQDYYGRWKRWQKKLLDM